MEKEKQFSDSLDEREVIDVAEYTRVDKKPPMGKKYKVKIDDVFYVFNNQFITGIELLEKAEKTPVECFTLYQKLKHSDFEKIDMNEKVDLAKPGIEHFVTKPPEVFHYTVDDEPETTDQKQLTPNQILELAGITPVSDYYLVLVNTDGSQVSYKDNMMVPILMRCPAMKFVSIFRGETPVS
jgi:hypothetical protein